MISLIFSIVLSKCSTGKRKRTKSLEQIADVFLPPTIFICSIASTTLNLLISFLFPQLYYFRFGDEGRASFSLVPGFWNRITSLLETLVSSTPLFFFFGPTVSIEVLTLLKLYNSVKFLLRILKYNQRKVFDSDKLCSHFCKMYRKLQVFSIFVNEYGKDYLRPNFEFVGSVLTILFSYSVIVLKTESGNENDKKMAQLGRFTFAFILIFLISWMACLHGLPSKPYVHSRKILHHGRSHWKSDSWSRKFFLSCQPIAVRIGDFHVIDKDRAPLIFQFCLRRIFYLAVQSK